MSTILVIDDQQTVLTTLSEVLTRAGYEVIVAHDGRNATATVARHSVDLVITDIIMPEKEGIETILDLRRAHPGVKIIAMSGFAAIGAGGQRRHRQIDFLEVSKQLGADATIRKPFKRGQLLDLIEKLLRPGDR